MSTKLEIARDRPLLFLGYLGESSGGPTEWQTLDLSTAYFWGNYTDHVAATPPEEAYGKYVDGFILGNDGGWPDFFFPDEEDLVLDRNLTYEFEFTYDPTHPLDDGERDVWLGAGHNTDTINWYISGPNSGTWNDLWNNDHDWTDVVTLTVSPGRWLIEAVPEGYDRLFIETANGGVVSQIRWRVVPNPIITYGEWQTFNLEAAEFVTHLGHTYGQHTGTPGVDAKISPFPGDTYALFVFPDLVLDQGIGYEFEVTQDGDGYYFGVIAVESPETGLGPNYELGYTYVEQTPITLVVGPGEADWDDWVEDPVDYPMIRFDVSASPVNNLRYRTRVES